jgi:hypothetical protein
MEHPAYPFTCPRCTETVIVIETTDQHVRHALHHLEETLVAKITDLAADIQALDGSVQTLITAFEALKEVIANQGTVLSAEDQAAVDAADAEVQALKQRSDAETAPPVETPPPSENPTA